MEQVHRNFNCEVTNCSVQGYTASLETEITTFDSNAILSAYQEELDTYLASPDAVIDGSQKRYQKSFDLLLESIESNKEVKTASAAFVLCKWWGFLEIKNDNLDLGNAIFGTLTTTPVDDENEISDDEE